jgi:sulfate transport system ATP-binding protein
MSIEVNKLRKRFGTFVALDDVSLNIPTGELVALLGPSGSGKTTLLRIIAGLEVPDAGLVRFDREEATNLSARDRNVGFVFQHYALFRHMSVFENVAFGLRVRPRRLRPSERKIRARVEELLGLVQLDWAGERLPSQLSGGQRQRVALARALAVEPKVLLLDEPFGALDAKVRQELRRWLRRLHDELHITSVFVTHDQEEALELANRVVVLNNGRIEQAGTPEEIYHYPATPFVYNFLGNVNLFHGRVRDGKVYIRDTHIAVNPGHQLAGADGQSATVYIRPHLLDIHLIPNGGSSFPATVRHINSAGPTVKVELTSQWGDQVQVEIGHDRFRALRLERTAEVYLSPRENKVFI